MWLKSHRWVDVPGTRTEKRWAMNVRESAHTAMVFDKKYVNVDTGKLDTDRLHTLNNLSLNDLVTEETYDYMRYANWNRYKNRKKDKRHREQPENNVYNFPKHVPKDNDFDEEVRREEIRKKQIAYEARLAEYEEGQRLLKEAKERYAKQLAEVEGRLLQESYERNKRIRENNYLRHAGNVRPNVWRPK